MSLDATIWAWKQQIRPSHKLILLSLADRAGADDTAWPSKKQLEYDTGIERKTVMDALRQLETIGLIKDTGSRKGPTKQVPVYRLIGVIHREEKGDQKRTPFGYERGPKVDNKGAQKWTTKGPKSGTRNLPSESLIETREAAIKKAREMVGIDQATEAHEGND